VLLVVLVIDSYTWKCLIQFITSTNPVHVAKLNKPLIDQLIYLFTDLLIECFPPFFYRWRIVKVGTG